MARFCLCLLVIVLLLATTPINIQAASDLGIEQPVVDDFDAEFDDDFLDDDTPLISDPFERLNRGVFWFNDKAYVYLMKPVARVLRVVPRPVRQSGQNFFSNLSSPVRIINTGLQCKFIDSGREILRFLVNTTVGIVGLFDVADPWLGLAKKDEDFGQTLGFYHIGQGPYLVLPLLGSSSLRAAGGLTVDTFLDPLTLITWDWRFVAQTGLRIGIIENALALDDDSYEKIKRDSLDPYLFMRAAYAQYRVAKVAQ